MAACGGEQVAPTPTFTPRPTPTFTPRSTELPLVPTLVLPGTEEQPLKIAIIGETDAAVNRAIRDAAEGLTDEMRNYRIGYYEGLQLEIELIDDVEQALTLLCNSTDTAVFVDVLTYITAERRCGAQPAFQVQRDGATASNFELVVFRQRVFDMTGMVGRKFCTMNIKDLTGFVHPALAFQAVGIDPFTDFEEIVIGFESEAEMVLAMTGRYEPGSVPRCDGAAIPAGTFSDIETELLDVDREQSLTEGQFSVVSLLEPAENEQWQAIPYEILVFPPDRLYEPHLRVEVTRAIQAVEEDDGQAKSDLQDLVPHEALIPVEASDYDPFRAWLERTGWNMGASATN